MRFDGLSKPVSDDQPAGPDLDEEMDSAYMNYTLIAPDRLPTSFLVSVPGTDERKPFDRSGIEITKEIETVAGFLEQTRDLRLVMLDARFNAAAGRFIEFTESTQGLAILVTTFWDDVHPKPADGDMIMRQNTVESLDDLGQIVLHLQHAPLAGGGRTRPISLRNYLVATGKAQAREGEETISISEISATMLNEANAARVAEVHAAIEASRAALETIRVTFTEKAGAEFAPSFPNLLDLYKQMIEMIGAYRTDLVPVAETASGTDEYGGEAGVSTLPAGSVKTHADASEALIAAESYFLRMEPSSPALILVHQARMLVGQPLTFALEALMPEPSNRAALRFDSGFKFDIDLSRMKFVTDDALSGGIPQAPPDESSSESSGSDDGWGSSSTSDDGWGSSETTSDDGWGSSESSEANTDSSSSETAAESTDPEAGSESTGDGWDSSESTDGGSASSSESEVAPEPEPEPAPPPPEPTGPVVFVARTRLQASELMHATELFYRAAEPSSAIPLLLSKARSYVSKDFASILSELIPRDADSN
jgi:type VI secretion system protein ImpA